MAVMPKLLPLRSANTDGSGHKFSYKAMKPASRNKLMFEKNYKKFLVNIIKMVKGEDEIIVDILFYNYYIR